MNLFEPELIVYAIVSFHLMTCKYFIIIDVISTTILGFIYFILFY